MNWKSFFIVAALLLHVALGQQQSVKTLLGAGGSFQSPLYQDWANTFNVLSPDVAVKYEGITQSDGKDRLLRNVVDFAGSDYNIFNETDYVVHPTYRLFPTFGGNVGFSYNIREFTRSDPRLVLSRDVVSRIFRGVISRWNHPDLVALQKKWYPNMPLINGTDFWDAKMPNRTIRLGLRQDAALVTTILGTGLVAADQWWSQQFGDYIQRNSLWPTQIQNITGRTLVRANLGMLGHLTTVSDAMGYHPFPYLVQFPEIRHFVMENIHGNLADPTDMDMLEDVMADITARNLSIDTNRIVLPEIIDPPLVNSWPYSTFNYIVVDTNATLGNCENRTALYKWINWALTSATASDIARRKGYVQLPRVLADTVLERIRTFNCVSSDGNSLFLLQNTTYAQRDGGTTAVFVIEMVLFAVAFLGLALFVFFITKTSQTAALEYFFTAVFFLGSVFVLVGIIMWFIVPTTDGACHSRVWFSALGITLILTSMFTRQYHLYKIYGHYRRNKLLSIEIMTKRLVLLSALIVSCGLAIQLIILILWQSLHPMRSVKIYRDEINLITQWTCEGGYVSAWLLVELIFVLVMLAFGIWVIYLAWGLRGHASETRGLLIATYNMILLCCVLTPLAIVAAFDETRVFYITTITLTFAVMSTAFALYWRKLVMAQKSYSSSGGTGTKSKTASKGGKSGKSRSARGHSTEMD